MRACEFIIYVCYGHVQHKQLTIAYFPCVLKQIFAYFGCVLKQIAAKYLRNSKIFSNLQAKNKITQCIE